MPEAAPLEAGDPRSLGQYEVVGRLGAGGQGAVFLAKSGAGEFVAIKLLHAQMAADPSARARFAREVAAAQKVEPFCTARVYEADVQGDLPYIVSEYIDGPSLHDIVAMNGPRGQAELERLAIGTVTALAAIHEAGIVHRDFKPNNVLLAADGPRVVDFGIARTVNSQESAVTATGMVVGTPGYLAPEQLSAVPLTPAVDIFAWGATIVFAATGASPFEAETLPVIINRILHEDPDLSALQGPLRDVVGRCLSKDPAARPQAAHVLLQLLGHVGAAPANPAPDREELLGQGTRIAAQLPAPPRNTPPPQHFTPPPQQVPQYAPPPRQTPPPQPMTPPPVPMYQGPPTPPPQPITPPPMPMYQGPPTPPPMPMQQPQMMAPRTQPPFPVAPPPPRQSGSNGPLIAAVGCGVLALVVVVGVVVAIVAAGKKASDDIRNSLPTSTPYTPPTYDSPSSSPTFGSPGGVPLNFNGVWRGTGTQQVNGSTKSWSVTYILVGTTKIGSVIYSLNPGTCSGRLALEGDATSYKAVYKLTISSGTCLSGYVTFYSLSSKSLKFEERTSLSSTPVATGTVTKP